jgi:hypothetical protein
MPLDVLGCTRATLTKPASFFYGGVSSDAPLFPWPEGPGNLVKLCRDGDRSLQLLIFNEEFLVSVSHQLALITSLPFVHTARRYYRLNGLVRPSDRRPARQQWRWALAEKLVKLGHLEEVKVVTRFP